MCNSSRKKKIKKHLGEEKGNAIITLFAHFCLGNHFEIEVIPIGVTNTDDAFLDILSFKIDKGKIQDFPALSKAIEQMSDVNAIVFTLDLEQNFYVIKAKKSRPDSVFILHEEEIEFKEEENEFINVLSNAPEGVIVERAVSPLVMANDFNSAQREEGISIEIKEDLNDFMNISSQPASEFSTRAPYLILSQTGQKNKDLLNHDVQLANSSLDQDAPSKNCVCS
jgi:hypothetical protein